MVCLMVARWFYKLAYFVIYCSSAQTDRQLVYPAAAAAPVAG